MQHVYKIVLVHLNDGVKDICSCESSYLQFYHFQGESQTHIAVSNPSALPALLPSTAKGKISFLD